MKNLLILILFILTFSFCKKNDNSFRLSEHYSKFKFHNLTEFKINKIDFNEQEKYYQKLDSLALVQVFQERDFSALYYYSTFSDSTLIALTGHSEELGPFISLLKYDKNGKVQEKVCIAIKGCDGGYCVESSGKLIGDKTFIRTDIERMTDEDLKNGAEQIDSTIVKIKFDKNNKIKIDTLFKNQEIIKNKK